MSLLGGDREAHVATADTVIAVADAYFTAALKATAGFGAFFVMWGAAIPSGGPLHPVFVVGDLRFRGAIEALTRAGQEGGTIAEALDPVASAVVFAGLVRGIAAQFLLASDNIDLKAARIGCERFIRSSVTSARPGRTSAPAR